VDNVKGKRMRRKRTFLPKVNVHKVKSVGLSRGIKKKNGMHTCLLMLKLGRNTNQFFIKIRNNCHQMVQCVLQ